MPQAAQREYILGVGDDEVVRLGFQHRVWQAEAAGIWRRAGIHPGMTVLDAGCGPGYATLDLAHLVGAAGRVLAIDESQRFLDHLRAHIAPICPAPVDIRCADVQDMDLPEACADAAYLRWVLCFIPDPARVVANVARALKPGGVLMVQDYFNYRAFTFAPRSEPFHRVVDAIMKSWTDRAGDPDLVARLPQICRRSGLELREVLAHQRVARPGDTLWSWPETFFHNFVPRLVEAGLLTSADKAAFEHDWAERAKNPDTFLCAPPVFDLIAVKR